MITKILASTAAISFALTTTAFAQDKSATNPDEDPTNKEKGIIAAVVVVGGIVPGKREDIKVETPDEKASKDMYLELGPIKGESQDKMPGGGEDRLTENVSIRGGGGGKVDVQDINIIEYAQDPKLGPIKGESQDKASVTGFTPFAGAALGPIASGKASGPLDEAETPACVTESGAVDADCNGVPDAAMIDDRNIRKRPEPRQQRR